MTEETGPNVAFVDGQNLHLGTRESGWSVDHIKFRTYLAEKYHVSEAYYFLGFVSGDEQDLYDNLQKAGFVLSFREHSPTLRGTKKGNVDSDIVFGVMKKLVDYLVKKGKFGKMLFPNRASASSLYQKLGGEFFDYLENPDVKTKISYSPQMKKAP